MFDRFTPVARRALVLAQEEARARCAERIEPAHVLLGLWAAPAAGLLVELGVGRAALARLLDGPDGPGGGTEAEPHRGPLAVIGIDLDEVRRAAEASFGPGALDRAMARHHRRARPRGHIRFAPTTRGGLSCAVREAAGFGERRVDPDLLTLGMLSADLRPLVVAGRRLEDARAALRRRRPGAASA